MSVEGWEVWLVAVWAVAVTVFLVRDWFKNSGDSLTVPPPPGWIEIHDGDWQLVKTWHKSRIRRAPKSRIYWRTLYLDYLAYVTDAGVYTVAPLHNVREYLEARGVKSGVAKKGEFAVGVRLA